MPPAIAAAAITAAATTTGAVLSSRSNNKAVSAQERANSEALAYERERERERERARAVARERWMAQRQQSFNDWYSRVGDEGIKRYGVPAGLRLPSATRPGGSPGVSSGMGPQRQRVTLSNMAAPQASAVAPWTQTPAGRVGQAPAVAPPPTQDDLRRRRTLATLNGY